MIEVKNLNVSLSAKLLLEDVNFKLRPGEFLAIVGPNGAGKSTLLKAIAGDLPLSQGEVLMDGSKIQLLCSREQALRRAFLEQFQHVSFPFTVEDIVRMGQYFATSSSQQLEQMIADVLDRFGVSHLRYRRINSLSGGESQRVHAARVLLQALASPRREKYILLDEPTASVDVKYQYENLQVFKRVTKKQIGVAAVLHDLNIAAQFADRVIVLHEGRLVAQGTPSEVLTSGRIRQVFGMECTVMPHPQVECPMMVYHLKSV
ncbi:MAG: heme ABC transporter ATP-binding protein [Oligoflexus sp.]